MSFQEWRLSTLEPLAKLYIEPRKGMFLTPLLVSSIVCGITFGVVAQQFIGWCKRSSKSEGWPIRLLAVYLVIASAAYVGLFTSYTSYLFAYHFGTYAASLNLTYTSWLFVIATMFIHGPCQAFYIQSAWKLSGGNRTVALGLFGLTGATLAIGATVRGTIPNFITELSTVNGIMIKTWLAAGCAADLAVSAALCFYLARSTSGRFANARLGKKLLLLIPEAQLVPTALSIGLLVLLMAKPTSPFANLWLGFPLVYPITIFASLSSRRGLREEIESEAEAHAPINDVNSEKGVEGANTKNEIRRPSFTDALETPLYYVQRASQEAMAGVRRASSVFGSLASLPAPVSDKHKTFPFRRRKATKTEAQTPPPMNPKHLHYPLQTPVDVHEEKLARASGLQRQHSLAPLDEEPHLAWKINNSQPQFFQPPQSVAMAPTLSDPFTPNNLNGPTTVDVDPFLATSPKAHVKPTWAESLAVHEAFELPGTPEMASEGGPNVGEVRDGVWYEVNLARQALGDGQSGEGEAHRVFHADDE